jgi:hypothetical protein
MNRVNYLFFIFVLFCINPPLLSANNIPELEAAQRRSVGENIYQNETASNPEHLLAWNNGGRCRFILIEIAFE